MRKEANIGYKKNKHPYYQIRAWTLYQYARQCGSAHMSLRAVEIIGQGIQLLTFFMIEGLVRAEKLSAMEEPRKK